MNAGPKWFCLRLRLAAFAADLSVAAHAHLQYKEVWLQQAIDLPAFAAYARAKDHNSEAAVEALEDGRALLLSEALGVDRARLVRLGQVGREDLQERFNAATERWNELLGKVESKPHAG